MECRCSCSSCCCWFLDPQVFLSKEFALPQEILAAPTAVPDDVKVVALAGKHKPVNPHRQRLLVASNKAVADEAVPDAVVAKHGAGKAAKPKRKPKACAKKKPQANAKRKASKPKGPKTWQDTAYNVAKKAFIAETLGLMSYADPWRMCVPMYVIRKLCCSSKARGSRSYSPGGEAGDIRSSLRLGVKLLGLWFAGGKTVRNVQLFYQR